MEITMKIAVLGNQARAMCNFWTLLIRRLSESGHEVICLVPESSKANMEAGLMESGMDGLQAETDATAWEKRLEDTGARVLHYPLDRKGLNPAKDLKSLLALRSVFAREQPEILFAYTIKPVIYGAMAAALAGSPARERRCLMITGLGYMFEGGSFVKRALMQVARLLYRTAFSCAGKVFFQNAEDWELFEKLSIIPQRTAVRMSKGCGVDTERFSPKPLPSGPATFLFVGRLLEAKGLRELAEAARLVKREHPEVRFCILGPEEHGAGSIPLAEVLQWQNEGILDYLGETSDVRPYIEKATAVVLPSWREGTPCSLLEAMSMERPIIAADAPGSREVIRHGINGLLTPVKDAPALAEAMKSLITDPSSVKRMGKSGRNLAVREFSADAVACYLMREMGIPPIQETVDERLPSPQESAVPLA